MMLLPLEENGRCIYRLKPGSPIPVNKAQEIGEYIAALSDEITPLALVEDAERAESPLHPFFEWDNTRAGYRWRVQ